MVIEIKPYLFACALLSPICFGDVASQTHYTGTQYLKNYALSACLADGYQSPEVVNDATASANGYKELGSFDIEAYNKALAIVRTFLKKEYASQSGEKLTAMKCIDLYNSKELDKLARTHAS